MIYLCMYSSAELVQIGTYMERMHLQSCCIYTAAERARSLQGRSPALELAVMLLCSWSGQPGWLSLSACASEADLAS